LCRPWLADDPARPTFRDGDPRAEGKVQFGWEESGRYGGIGLQTGKYMSVNCIDANMALREVIARHGRIDILKIDIETLEKQVTERIPADVSCKIRKIYC
jgi:hypothetical protein